MNPDAAAAPSASLAVVTASDSAYYPHLRNLLYSLGRQTDRWHRVVVVDVGLSADERAAIEAAGHAIIRYAGTLFGDGRTDLASFEVRACLDQLIPDADFILWLDADLWLQSPTFLADLRRFVQDYDLLVTPQLDAGYRRAFTFLRVRPGWFGVPRVSGWNFDRLVRSYGRRVAFPLASHATANAGVFIARRRSPIWEEWRERFRASRLREFASEQFALTRTFAETSLPSAALDAGFNWCCSFTPPVLDGAGDFFRKPNPPYDIIRAIHMTDVAKTTRYKIKRLGGAEEREIAFFDPAVVKAAIDACAAAPTAS